MFGHSADALMQRACDVMGLNWATAKLGYRLLKDTLKTEPKKLDLEEDINAVISTIEVIVRRVRTNVPELKLVNLGAHLCAVMVLLTPYQKPNLRPSKAEKRKIADENEAPALAAEVVDLYRTLEAAHTRVLSIVRRGGGAI